MEQIKVYKDSDDTIILEDISNRNYPVPECQFRIWKDGDGKFWLEDLSRHDSKHEVVVLLGHWNKNGSGWHVRIPESEGLSCIVISDAGINGKRAYVWLSTGPDAGIKKITRDEAGRQEVENLIFPVGHLIADVLVGMVTKSMISLISARPENS